MQNVKSNRAVPLRFSLTHILYVFAVLGASLGLCGSLGLIVGVFVLWCWWVVFQEAKKPVPEQVAAKPERATKLSGVTAPFLSRIHRRRMRGFTVAELLVVVFIILMLWALLMPAISCGRHRAFRRQLAFRHISLALEAYHTDYGCFPPAYVCDESGRPMHSWRVLVLPYLGEDDLYTQYDFEQPWDGPENTKLLKRTRSPYTFCNDSGKQSERHLTTCFAVTNSNGVWDTDISNASYDGERLPRIEDLLVADFEHQPVPWTAPLDISTNEAQSRLSEAPDFPQGQWTKGFFWSICYGRTAIMANGTVLNGAIQHVDEASTPAAFHHVRWRTVHYGNFFRLGVFLLIVFWPVGRLRRVTNQHRTRLVANTTDRIAAGRVLACGSIEQLCPKPSADDLAGLPVADTMILSATVVY